MKELFLSKLDEYLSSYRWQPAKSCSCGKTYYSKRASAENCGGFKCAGGYDFLLKGKRHKQLTLQEIIGSSKEFFGARGFTLKSPMPLLNPRGSTIFVGAAIDNLSQLLFDEAEIIEERTLVGQPSIRTQYLDSVSASDGSSTSFVNLATLQVNPSIEGHLANFDTWLGFLSTMGIYLGDITLAVRQKADDWGNGPHKNMLIELNYGGLEIGAAELEYEFPQKTRDDLMISDIGFGLERLAWAANKNSSYFENIGPLLNSWKGDRAVMDRIRTMTLMAMSGVNPLEKDSGYQLRRFSYAAAESLLLAGASPESVLSLVDHYYSQWSDFWQPIAPLQQCRRTVSSCLTTAYNTKIGERLNVKKIDPQQSTEQYLHSLIANGIKEEQIRKVIFPN